MSTDARRWMRRNWHQWAAHTLNALIVAERLGRRCNGIEIAPEYGDVILRRWEVETGREAVLLERISGRELVKFEA